VGARLIVGRIKPNHRLGPLVEQTDDELILYVREPAIDGRANAAAVELLADHLGLRRGQVRLVAGHKARIKRFEIDD